MASNLFKNIANKLFLETALLSSISGEAKWYNGHLQSNTRIKKHQICNDRLLQTKSLNYQQVYMYIICMRVYEKCGIHENPKFRKKLTHITPAPENVYIYAQDQLM